MMMEKAMRLESLEKRELGKMTWTRIRRMIANPGILIRLIRAELRSSERIARR